MRSQTSINGLPARHRGVTHPSQLPGYALLRLIWIAVGPVLMMVLLVLKMESGIAPTGSLDIAFCALTSGILTIRWMTWFTGDKYSAFGRKATLQSLLRFTMRFVLFSCGVWILAIIVAAQRAASDSTVHGQSRETGSVSKAHQSALTSVDGF